MAQQFLRAVERVTGLWAPSNAQLGTLVQRRQPKAYRFADDGKTPNNRRFPLLIYRQVLQFDRFDPAAIAEATFASNGWRDMWRDKFFTYMHFHSSTHEALAICRGWARLTFGGTTGRQIEVKAGDAIVVPAGVGHRGDYQSRDLLVVGAYPESGDYDEPRSSKAAHDAALPKIQALGCPKTDPLFGASGPLQARWRQRSA